MLMLGPLFFVFFFSSSSSSFFSSSSGSYFFVGWNEGSGVGVEVAVGAACGGTEGLTAGVVAVGACVVSEELVVSFFCVSISSINAVVEEDAIGNCGRRRR